MHKTIEDFIKHNAGENDACYYYSEYSQEIKKMLRNLYSCCFRFDLYKSQTLFLLNKALEPFKKSESLLFEEVGGWE